MTRKIIFIIIGALLFLALLWILWFWLLHRSSTTGTESPGSFATSTDRITGGVGVSGSSNTATQVPGAGTPTNTGGVDIQAGGIDTSGGLGGNGSAGSGGINSGGSSSGSSSGGGTLSGAWVGSSVSTREFTPAQINEINSTAGVSGAPLISTTPQAAGLGTSGLIIGAAAAGCLAQYIAYETLGAGQAALPDKALAITSGPYVVVFDAANSAKQNNQKFKNIEQCLVKTIAQAAIDQITRSVVTWINSGFNGKPSFVTNFNQYFANVADQAAGEFIKGSALSFLCSPFAPQIRIAIAQSYANRNAGASCSLTKVTNNINGFLRGTWSAGGWGGLLQFTTVPTNNPYGAYAYAQAGLNNSIANAQNNARSNVSPGGFISLQKCDPEKNQSMARGNCTVSTPGGVIEESLKKSVIDSPLKELDLAQNINEIITALTRQVMIKTLYGGLGNSLGGVTNPLAPAVDQGASAQAQALLAQLQASLNNAGQYASVQQGSIVDIQQAQANLNSAFNCWSAAASSTALSTAQQADAAQKATSANSAQAAYEIRVATYNNEITRANASLAAIQNLQSQVYFATTPEGVSAAAQAIAAASAQGTFITQADVTTAQQNRTTLQAELATRNQQTNASIAQCRAL